LPEVISNTSPLQYLHQLGLLDLLPRLVGNIVVPPAVVEELEAGRALGLDLPDVTSLDWITVKSPGERELHPTARDLGRGETEVLRLALGSEGETILILDDGRAREEARSLGLRLTGTLGVLLDAKRAGLLPSLKEQLNRLDDLGFRLASHTREAVLKLAGEVP
jgi:predicted nucleic acid-binding protein